MSNTYKLNKLIKDKIVHLSNFYKSDFLLIFWAVLKKTYS